MIGNHIKTDGTHREGEKLSCSFDLRKKPHDLEERQQGRREMLGIDHAEEERQQGKVVRAIYTYATPESEPNRNGNFWHLRNLI